MKLRNYTSAKNNLHITISDFRFASRIIKQTSSMVDSKVAEMVFIAALHSKNTKNMERLKEKISIQRFRLKTRGFGKNIFSQLLKYLEYFFEILFFYKKKQIHQVNIHSLALLPIGVCLKFLWQSTLIYDIHELETERNGLHGFRKVLSKIIETLLIPYVDSVFVVSESIADWYEKNYKIARPTVVMNSPKYLAIKRNNIFREKFLIPSDSLIFLYQGVIAPGRGIDILIKAFQTRKDNKAILVVMGHGSLEGDVKKAVESGGNIFFHPSVPPSEVMSYTSSADIGLALIENTCLSYYYCMPNKLFEYLMAGLPVIVSNMKEMSDFVSRFKVGYVLNAQSVEDLNGVIDKALLTNLVELRNNAHKAAVDHCWAVQEKKMVNAYRSMVSKDFLCL